MSEGEIKKLLNTPLTDLSKRDPFDYMWKTKNLDFQTRL